MKAESEEPEEPILKGSKDEWDEATVSFEIKQT